MNPDNANPANTFGRLRGCASAAWKTARRGTSAVLFCAAALFFILGAFAGAGCAWLHKPVDRKGMDSDLMTFDDEDLNRDLAGGDLGVTGATGAAGGGGGGGC
jgi:hypothetical protein